MASCRAVISAGSAVTAVTTAEVQVMGTPDLTLQELRERWDLGSNNSVKARAQALGVELRRESSTRTVWPREFLPLGDELHDHLKSGGTLRDFPGSVPQPQTSAASKSISAGSAVTSLTSSGNGDAMALAMLQLLHQQQAAQVSPALMRARAMAQAADERLPLTTGELAELVGLPIEELVSMKTGNSLYGFRLQRVGPAPRKGSPDRRAWLLEREGVAADPSTLPVSAGSSLPSVTSAAGDGRRRPGFMACFDAEATVLSRLELPRW